MSTRSTISIVNADKTLTGVYCHSDGYLDHVGGFLLNTYNTEEKARELIGLGHLSCLYENIAPLPVAPGRRKAEGLVIAAESHSFDTPQQGVTIAYHRDREEEFEQYQWANIEEWKESDLHEIYNYYFEGGKWFVKYFSLKTVHELTADLIKEGIDPDSYGIDAF